MSLYHNNQAIYPKSIALNVKDLRKMVQFYKDILGFKLHESKEGFACFTANGKDVLLELYQTNSVNTNVALYHVAYLFNSKEALASIFRHILVQKYPMTGGADHTVSDALYLDDPEGNGIELYFDTQPDAWDDIEAHPERLQNYPFPYDEYLRMAKKFYSIDSNTIIGHIHLHAINLKDAVKFYETVFGYDTIAKVPSAYFMSSQRYHHHIALNTWRVPTVFDDKNLGLKYIVLETEANEVREQLLNRINSLDNATSNDDVVLFKDANGYAYKIKTQK